MSPYDAGYKHAKTGRPFSRGRSWLSPAYSLGYEKAMRERRELVIARIILGLALATVTALVALLGTGLI